MRRLLAACTVIVIAMSGCSLESHPEPDGKLAPQELPVYSPDESRVAVGAAYWVQSWAARKGTERQHQVAKLINLIGGEWRQEGDLALIDSKLTDKDDAHEVVEVFLGARKEDPEYTGHVSVGVYDEGGALLLYQK